MDTPTSKQSVSRSGSTPGAAKKLALEPFPSLGEALKEAGSLTKACVLFDQRMELWRGKSERAIGDAVGNLKL